MCGGGFPVFPRCQLVPDERVIVLTGAVIYEGDILKPPRYLSLTPYFDSVFAENYFIERSAFLLNERFFDGDCSVYPSLFVPPLLNATL